MQNKESEWSNEQIEAIETRGTGIVVSAAAGSGKTSVLIERAIQLLSDESNPIPADTLLAVTFTNAAAAQLRNKLTAALVKKIQEHPENGWLEKQQSLLQMAKIQTINSFCLDIVKNNAHTLGLQSGVRILEENEIIIIENEMLRKAVNEFYKSRPDDMKMLIGKMCRNKPAIIGAAKTMYDYLRSIPFSKDYMEQSINKLRSPEDVERYCHDIIASKLPYCSRMQQLLQQALMLCDRLSIKYKLDEKLSNCLSFIDTLQNLLTKNEWDKAHQLLSSYKIPQNKNDIGVKEEPKYTDHAQLEADREIVKSIAKLYAKATELIKDIQVTLCYPLDEAVRDCETSARLAEILYAIVQRANKLISEEKLSRNGLDFADVELMTAALLAEKKDGVLQRTPLCEEMLRSGEFKVILIDEFQDTNDLQELIFRCISDTDDLEILGKNVFVVGDIKQAIYGFRRSNPRLFLEARRKTKLDEYQKLLKEIQLTTNFRSRKNIIEFTNFLFSQLMSEKVGEVDYGKGERLSFGKKYEGTYPTEFMLCKDEGYDAIAAKIHRMIRDGAQVYDKELGAYRNCRPGDFGILSRTNNHNYKFSLAFEKYGLSIACREIDGYLRSREISLMISLLKVLDNPMNDLALLAVMLSPIFSFTDDDVARLKTAAAAKCGKRLYRMLSGVQGGDVKVDDALKIKCSDTFEKIKKLRHYAACLPIEQLIRKLYADTDFYILTASFSGGERAQANLRLLRELAADYDNAGNGGLSGFLHYFDSILDGKKDFRQAATATEENDAVNVMTMHKSKGLELPFVFLFDLEHDFRFDTSYCLLMDESGIGIKITDTDKLLRYPTCVHTVIASKKEAAIISEELRLLYVAVTRAKEQLFIAVSAMEDKELNNLRDMLSRSAAAGYLAPDVVASAKCMLDWVLAACAFHNDGDQLLEALGVSLPPLPKGSECEIVAYDVDTEETTDSEAAATDGSCETDRSLSKRIYAMLSQQTPARSDAFAKLSVSEIVHPEKAEKDKFPQICIPDLSKTGKTLTAAQRGTLTHRFIELCDLDAASNNVEAELQRLVSLGRFSPEEAKAINTDALKQFFSGSFAKRMMSSKRLLREKEFMVKLSDLCLPNEEPFKELAYSDGMLQGIADCLFEESDGYVLVDYKTDRVKELSKLIELYSLQLKLYKAALTLILDKPIKDCVIYSLHLGDSISVT